MSGKLFTICHCEQSEAIAETRRLLRGLLRTLATALRLARNDKYLTGHDITWRIGK